MLAVETDDRLGECRYGEWEGQALKTLAKDPLWKVVQAHPSAATFPGGEALRDTQARAVEAVRDAQRRGSGPDATWIAVSHGDVIKAILADALGMHLDALPADQVDPASVSVVRYTELRPFVAADERPRRRGRRPDAAEEARPPPQGGLGRAVGGRRQRHRVTSIRDIG